MKIYGSLEMPKIDKNLSSKISPSPLAGEGRGEGSHRKYDIKTKTFARNLRKNQTDVEIKLWSVLRNNNFKDFKFRRQFQIDNKYIADFVCLEKRLIIELDGGQHSESNHDKIRTKYINKQNFKILRFWNNEINKNMDGCLAAIMNELLKNPHPDPLPQGTREHIESRKQFKRNIENFICKHCGTSVVGNGYTNHCPKCLYSLDVDINPGDRASNCGGLMKPIGITVRGDDYIIHHKCVKCGKERPNKSSPNDDMNAIIKISKQEI